MPLAIRTCIFFRKIIFFWLRGNKSSQIEGAKKYFRDKMTNSKINHIRANADGLKGLGQAKNEKIKMFNVRHQSRL